MINFLIEFVSLLLLVLKIFFENGYLNYIERACKYTTTKRVHSMYTQIHAIKEFYQTYYCQCLTFKHMYYSNNNLLLL